MMNRLILPVLALVAAGLAPYSHAADVPRCWSDEHSDVLEGYFKIGIPTRTLSGLDLTNVFGLLHFQGQLKSVSPNFAVQNDRYVAKLDTLFIAFEVNPLSAGASKTEKARFKRSISANLTEIVKLTGASIWCVDSSGTHPNPGGTISN